MKPGTKCIVTDAIYYHTYAGCTKSEISKMRADGFIIKTVDKKRWVIIPAHTVLTYITNEYNGWPTYKIGNNEYDLCECEDYITEHIVEL